MRLVFWAADTVTGQFATMFARTIGRMTQHPLRLLRVPSFLNFPTGEPFHVPVDSLNEVEGYLTLHPLQVDVWHPLGIFLHHDVAVVCVDDEIPGFHPADEVSR